MKKTITACLVAIVALTSCTIQKRQYTKGYYVAFKHKSTSAKQATKPVALQTHELNLTINPPVKQELTASVASYKIENMSHKTRSVLQASSNSRSNHSILPPAVLKVNKNVYKPRANFATKMFMIEPPQTSGKAIAALVLGILALVTYYGALVMAILAIIFGVKAIKQINAEPDKYKGKGMAKAGMVMGIVGCVLLLVLIMLVV